MAIPEFTADELATEEWRPVVGLGGVYSVSSLGRLRRDVAAKTGGTYAGRLRKLKLAKGARYILINFSVRGKRIRRSLHSVVAEAFIGPCPKDREVNHKDGVRLNNRADNLEYTTSQGNSMHAAQLGLLATGDRNGMRLHPESRLAGDDHWTRKKPDKVAKGERQGSASTTDEEVLYIRALAAGGMKRADIARLLGRRFNFVSRIVTRETWKHI